MLQLVFLGTSGSTPTTERGMPAIALKYESDLMLWDCGEGTQRQLMRYKVGYGSVSQVYVTHPHLDHYLGLFGLLETMKLSAVSPKKLEVHSSIDFDENNVSRYGFASFSKMRKGTVHPGRGYSVSAFPVKHCRGSYGLVFQEDDMRKFHEEKAHSLGLKGRLFREIQEKGKVKAGGREILLDDVTWVRPGRKVVYSGDCRPSDATLEAAKGADLLVHEGTFDASRKEEAEERLHSTVEEAASLAKKAGVRRLAITHISPRYSDAKPLEEEAKRIFPDSLIAYDGLRLDIPFRK